MKLSHKHIPVRLRLLNVAGMCAFMGVADASAELKTLVVDRVDGTGMEFTLSDDLSMKFAGSDFTVNSGDGLVSIPVETVAGFHMSEQPAGIGLVNAGNDAPAGQITSAGVLFSGLPANASVQIFDEAGRLRHSEKSTGADLQVSFEVMATGVNVIKAGACTFKVVKP